MKQAEEEAMKSAGGMGGAESAFHASLTIHSAALTKMADTTSPAAGGPRVPSTSGSDENNSKSHVTLCECVCVACSRHSARQRDLRDHC